MSRGDDPASVLHERRGRVAWITLNRPDRLNAFAGTMRVDLHAAIAAASRDAETRVIVITGAGRAFCAGADVDAMEQLLEARDERNFGHLLEAGMRVVMSIRSTPKLVVAAVNGVAVGAGAALATACDLRLASDHAKIGFTFNRIGLHPDWGATYSLPRLVGAARAAELIFSGRILEVQEASQIGLWTQVFPAADFHDEVAAYAEDLAAKPPLAVAAAKQTLERSIGCDLQTMLDVEAGAQVACFRTQDVREGIRAFREKRLPSFRGE